MDVLRALHELSKRRERRPHLGRARGVHIEQDAAVALDDRRVCGGRRHALCLGRLLAWRLSSGRPAALRHMHSTRRQEVSDLAQGAPERGLRRRGHHEVALSRSRAVRARPGVMGNARGQGGLRALDEPGEAAIVDARAARGDVLEHAHHGVRERRAAACRKALADLVHRAAFLGRRRVLSPRAWAGRPDGDEATGLGRG